MSVINHFTMVPASHVFQKNVKGLSVVYTIELVPNCAIKTNKLSSFILDSSISSKLFSIYTPVLVRLIS